MRRNRKASKVEGFSLIEVLTAVAVLGIGLVAVLHLFSLSTKSVFISRQYTHGLLLAQKKMAEIEMAQDPAVLPSEGDFGDEWPDYSWQMETVPQDDLPNLTEIKLNVSWEKAGITRSFTITTYRIVEETMF